MDHKLFSIYDQKAYAYLPPFTLPRVEQAIRTFSDCVNSPDHAFGRHPADYTLVEIGEYDDSNAKITVHEVHIVVGTGIEFLRSKNTPSGDPPNGDIQSVSNDPPIQPSPIGGNSS